MDPEVEFRIGRRREDGKILLDYAGSRFVMVREVDWTIAINLEEISKSEKNVVVYRRGWYHQYFMRYRFGWSIEQYFNEADRLLKERGIENP